jgi:hypothetical protein
MEKEDTLDLDTMQNNHAAESRDRKGENIWWAGRGSRRYTANLCRIMAKRMELIPDTSEVL